MPVLNPRVLCDTLVANIRAYHKLSGVTRAELDLSGGIDSAVMLGLLSLAVGPENITAIYLGINSNPDSYSRAKDLSDSLGVKLIHFDGTALFNDLLRQMVHKMGLAGYDCAEINARIDADPTILGSIRSTLRAPWGRAANRLSGGGIRHGTGNEDEDRWLRFFQKGGDGEVDTNPISMLSKGEVYQLAWHLGERLNALSAYVEIIAAIPSADLWGVGDTHNDQNEIGNYLGVRGYPVYSFLNFTVKESLPPRYESDGRYHTVGIIERVSRFLDGEDDENDNTWNYVLFQDDQEIFDQFDKTRIFAAAKNAPEFTGIPTLDVYQLLLAARKIEKQTRHKWNPNCPALTSRHELLKAGALTNLLPL